MVPSASETRLVPATPAHFDWAIRGVESQPSFDGLRLPPGGLDAAPVLEWLERTAKTIDELTGARSAWIIASGDEAVGLISYKAPPADAAVEIGYGIAASRRDRGHASRAVALLVREASRAGLSLTAETATGNRASEVVFEKSSFARVGTRLDAEEGALVCWRRDCGA